jgi:hypothetical protein
MQKLHVGTSFAFLLQCVILEIEWWWCLPKTLFMKLNTFFVLLLLLMVVSTSHAQVANEELKKYILTMDSIETLKNQLTVSMNNLAKGNSKISSNRFNELTPIYNNDAKLTEAKATPDEIAYVKKAVTIRDEETRKFQQSYQSLIHDFVGEAVFSKVRNGLKTDASLKKRYDSLMVKPIRQ